jgi:hypothetical protein
MTRRSYRKRKNGAKKTTGNGHAKAAEPAAKTKPLADRIDQIVEHLRTVEVEVGRLMLACSDNHATAAYLTQHTLLKNLQAATSQVIDLEDVFEVRS